MMSQVSCVLPLRIVLCVTTVKAAMSSRARSRERAHWDASGPTGTAAKRSVSGPRRPQQPSPSPPPARPVTTTCGTQTNSGDYSAYCSGDAAPMPRNVSTAIATVLRELLVVVLQDDVDYASRWARDHTARRTFALSADDAGVGRLLESVINATLGLKRRVVALSRQFHDVQRGMALAITSPAKHTAAAVPLSPPRATGRAGSVEPMALPDDVRPRPMGRAAHRDAADFRQHELDYKTQAANADVVTSLYGVAASRPAPLSPEKVLDALAKARGDAARALKQARTPPASDRARPLPVAPSSRTGGAASRPLHPESLHRSLTGDSGEVESGEPSIVAVEVQGGGDYSGNAASGSSTLPVTLADMMGSPGKEGSPLSIASPQRDAQIPPRHTRPPLQPQEHWDPREDVQSTPQTF
jgi:hypothetical protein